MEISKEGMLYIHGGKFGKRTWRKTWGVLYNPSSKGFGRLELYCVLNNNNGVPNQKKWHRLKAPECRTVHLSDCLSVSAAPKESCPDGCSAFYLHTRQCVYTLASPPGQDWLSCLCTLVFQSDSEDLNPGSSERGTDGLIMKENELYSSWTAESDLPPNTYHVTVQSTEASRRCNLSGTYLFSLEPEAVTLLTCNSGQVLYTWSYRQLRQLKQVEGGFSFRARQGCQSGGGVFIFLCARAPEILQSISDQRSMQTSTSVQPLVDNHRSLGDQNPNVIQTVTSPPAVPSVYAPADDPAETEHESANLYSNINHRPRPPPALRTPSIWTSTEAVGDEGENDNDQCHYLEGLRLDIQRDRSVSCDLRRTSPAPTQEDASQCIYAAVKKTKSPVEPQVETFSSYLLQPPPCPLPQPGSYSPYPKPRYQHQLPVNNLIQPALGAHAQAVDDIKEMEEAISSSAHVTPTEPPGSFKYRLAAIISKDLAKSQPDPQSGVSSSTLSW